MLGNTSVSSSLSSLLRTLSTELIRVKMAVAAMVARQMREARSAANQPDENWSEEERELFELQKRSKATFKVKINN